MTTLLLSSCSLDEYNPSGFTMESVAASSVEGYRNIVNNIYFGMERRLYGYNQWMMFTEGGTDLWTYQKNADSWSQFFKYGAGANIAPNTGNEVWNSCYDGIGSCNIAIAHAKDAPFSSEQERNAMVAEAYFMRAMYYYNLVEQFGGATITTEPVTDVDTHPEKAAPMDIYEQVIIPDLAFAAEWLPIDNGITKPSKKSALGLLARAYLQTVAYDDSKAYAGKALEVAKELIADSEAGGGKYNTYLYPSFQEVFAEENNENNKEALWAHRFVIGGVSNNAWYMNMNNELFYCSVTDFGAMQQSGDTYTTWGGRSGGQFMPSNHLLQLFVQDDGTLDPRFHESFQTDWNTNRDAYNWSAANLSTFDRSDAVQEGDGLVRGDRAISFLHTAEADYKARVATKLDQPYLVVDMQDVYNTQTGAVKMQYNRVNRPSSDGGAVVNPFFSFYPSLSKHNSSNYYANNPSSNRYGNLNATFMMRMAEVYLIAAEADIYVNGGANAAGYINKLRTRAGANLFTGTPNVDDVINERAVELCGEYLRFYDLKRTKKLNKTYLMATNPDVGTYFMDNVHEVRPIPTSFLNTIQDGGVYYQNNGY